MSANIEKMFYYGERPWHGLGTELNKPATAAEAIAAAGMGWSVEKRPLHTPAKSGPVKIDGHFATVRSDNDAVLGIVGDQYEPIQNTDAFSFFDDVVGRGQAIYHTGGSLGRGERIWILAKLPGEIHVTKNDDVEKYLLLSNSHNGWSSLRMFYTPVRVVCQNTLNMALAGVARQGIAIRHTGDIRSKVTLAQRTLNLAVKFYDDFGLISHQLVKAKLTTAQVNGYFHKVVPDRDPRKVSTRAENVRQELVRLFETGKGNGLPGTRGTAWAALNAVAEYTDYVRVPRAQDETRKASNRLESVWFGSGAAMKARAWDEAMVLVKK